MLHSLLQWIRESPPGQFVREDFWVFPTLEALHFLGMAMLFGVVAVIDLQVLGIIRGLPVAGLHRFLPWAFAGFGINLVSGILFFAADPDAYAFNPAFRLKMLCLMLAGLNAFWFYIHTFPTVGERHSASKALRLAKLISALSLLLWVAVITCGRLIPFVTDV